DHDRDHRQARKTAAPAKPSAPRRCAPHPARYRDSGSAARPTSARVSVHRRGAHRRDGAHRLLSRADAIDLSPNVRVPTAMVAALPILDDSFLDRIQIATPCDAKWDDMKGDHHVR